MTIRKIFIAGLAFFACTQAQALEFTGVSKAKVVDAGHEERVRTIELLNEDEGFCFLTGVEKMGVGDAAEVFLRGGKWLLVVKTDNKNYIATGYAGCMKF